MDARPREWSKLIRVSNKLIQSDLGYVEYLIVLQYANNWQSLDSIFHSRSQVRNLVLIPLPVVIPNVFIWALTLILRVPSFPFR